MAGAAGTIASGPDFEVRQIADLLI